VRELFRIETDRVTLQWSEPSDRPPLHGLAPPLGRLIVTPLRPGLQLRRLLRDGVAAAERTIGARLYEATPYTLFASSRAGAVRVLHDDPNLLGALVAAPDGEAVAGTVNFGSQVGTSTFRLLVGGEAELEFEVEVFPSKLDYADDYVDLMADTQDFLSALALQYLAATRRLAMPAGSGRTTYLDWLAVLRHVLDTLEAALRQIARQPSRALRHEPAPVRLERLRRADARVRNALRRPNIARTVVTRSPSLTLDTAEHRWLNAQIAHIRRRLASLLAIESARSPTPRQREIVAQLRGFEARIAALQQLEPLRAATGPPPPGFASLQLMKAAGYAEAYRAAMLLTQGIRIDGDVLRTSVKDIATLYEYWCFLVLARRLAEACGSARPLLDLVKIDQHGLRVTLRKGQTQRLTFQPSPSRSIALTYNPLFRDRAPLIAQQPDIVFTVDEEGWPLITLVIDAKYRIDAQEETIQQFGAPGPPADALNVLHRYRDAILETPDADAKDAGYKHSVVQVAALFPYRERTEDEFASSRYWTSLQRIGIGAIPLLPRGERYLDRWLDSILGSGGWALADRVIPNQSHDAAWEWRRAASETVLIATLRKGEEERHLDWIRTARLYYLPETKQERLFNTRWIAFYSPAGTTAKHGVIRYWSPVEHIETRVRAEIDTPWQPRRDPDERQVVFHLGEMRAGLNVRNARSERVSNRWSTRLALLRARSLEQLLLETEPEWRVYEHLRAVRAPFVIKPQQVRAIEAEDARGRALFVVGEDRLRHNRGSRFLVSTGAGAMVEMTLENVLRRYGRE
jgi:hypothetical protein